MRYPMADDLIKKAATKVSADLNALKTTVDKVAEHKRDAEFFGPAKASADIEAASLVLERAAGVVSGVLATSNRNVSTARFSK